MAARATSNLKRRTGVGDGSNRYAQSPRTGSERMASIAIRGANAINRPSFSTAGSAAVCTRPAIRPTHTNQQRDTTSGTSYLARAGVIAAMVNCQVDGHGSYGV